MPRPKLRWLLVLAMLIALGLRAWGWRGVLTEHLYLVIPDSIPDLVHLSAEAERVLAEVWTLWLPHGLETKLPQPNISAALEEFAPVITKKLGLELKASAGPSFGVLLYDDPEQLWRETRHFGIAGAYMDLHVFMSNDFYRSLWERFLQGAPEG